MELRKSEEREEITKDGQNIRGFQREIKQCFNCNFDDKLNAFITKHNLTMENHDNVYWLIKYNQFLKE